MPAPPEPNARGSARVPAGVSSSGRATVGASRGHQSGGGSGGGRGRYPGGGAYRGKRRPRWGRIILVCLLALVLLVVIGGIGAYAYANSLDGQLKRTDAFAGLTNRPENKVSGTENILMLGSDSRDPGSNNGWRPDTIMLVHLDADHNHAYVVSIARDTYVFIPKSPDGQNGNTKDKINSAFAWGGAPLMVQTVEGFTGVRVDHVVISNFGGFQSITDAVGGVDMYVDQTITSIHTPHRTFTQGWRHFNGAEALDYCRQRYQFADGDFARQRHQQAFLRALMKKAGDSGTLSNPFKLADLADSATKVMLVDKDFHLVDQGWNFIGLKSSDITFLPSPYSGTDDVDGESVVLADKEKASALYTAMSQDKIADWIKSSGTKTN